MLDIYDKEGRIVQILGGMESFILEISYKIVITREKSGMRSKFLIIDEGISSLDKENLSNIEEIFKL